MRNAILLTFVCLFALSCGPENNTISTVNSGNNNGDNNNPPNNETECRIDVECDEYFYCDQATRTCEPGECLDGRLSAGETDIDCGGDCEPCGPGKACISLNDCAEGTTCSNDECVETVPNSDNNIAPTCEEPGDRPHFPEWGTGGLVVTLDVGDFDLQAGATITNGFAVEDFNNDGAVDIFNTNAGEFPDLWLNRGNGTFEQTRATMNIPNSQLRNTTAVETGDIDGDGDADLVLGHITGVYVLINDGTANFVDATEAWIGQSLRMVSSLALGDFTGDGLLDLYVGNYVRSGESFLPNPLENNIYRNTGTSFAPLTEVPGGADTAGATLATAWHDFNEDGALDLWVVNDFGGFTHPNQVFLNRGPDANDPNNWLFEDVAPSLNMDVEVFGMSATIGDVDNDGDSDYYVANMAQNVLHINDGTTTTDEAGERGVYCAYLPDPRPEPAGPPPTSPPTDIVQQFWDEYIDTSVMQYTLTSFGSVFFDANHDGWLDLYVVNGAVDTDLTPESINQPNYFFMNDGDGTFTQQPCWFMGDVRGTSRALAVGDFDGDGDMDVVWGDNGLHGESTVYMRRNEVADGNYVTFKLRGTPPATDAIGAKVELTAGGMTQTRWINGGGTYMSISERVAHFGLGDTTTVDSVTVTWPDGTTQDVAVDAVNQRIVVTQE